MADTTFTDGVTLTAAAWFQDLNDVYYKLTANRIPYATGTALTSSANLTFNGTTLTAHTLTVSTGATTISGTATFAGATSNSAASAGQFFVRGGQLGFPATQIASTDVNTLDDYEEGTKALTFAASTSGTITILSTADTVTYTKVGRDVTVRGRVEVTSVSSPVGIWQIAGLPFTSATTAQAGLTGEGSPTAVGSVYIESLATAYTNTAIIFLDQNSSTAEIRLAGTTGAGTATAAQVQAGTVLHFCLSYITNT